MAKENKENTGVVDDTNVSSEDVKPGAEITESEFLEQENKTLKENEVKFAEAKEKGMARILELEDQLLVQQEASLVSFKELESKDTQLLSATHSIDELKAEIEVLSDPEGEVTRLTKEIGDQAARIINFEAELKQRMDEKDAKIALLNTAVDRLQNPYQPIETHFGEKNG